jgi:hypothetical protein
VCVYKRSALSARTSGVPEAHDAPEVLPAMTHHFLLKEISKLKKF